MCGGGGGGVEVGEVFSFEKYMCLSPVMAVVYSTVTLSLLFTFPSCCLLFFLYFFSSPPPPPPPPSPPNSFYYILIFTLFCCSYITTVDDLALKINHLLILILFSLFQFVLYFHFFQFEFFLDFNSVSC